MLKAICVTIPKTPQETFPPNRGMGILYEYSSNSGNERDIKIGSDVDIQIGMINLTLRLAVKENGHF